MKIKCIAISLLFLTGISCKINDGIPDSKNRRKFECIENLNGEGLFPHEFGKIINRMKDEAREIHKDSLEIYYKVIDTTHIFHSIKSEANVYESTVYDHMRFKKIKNGVIKGETINSTSGYSYLHIKLENQYCYAWINYNSTASLVGEHIFNLKSGEIFIDKPLIPFN